MLTRSNKILFFLMTILSTMMVMSSNNWFSMWMGMEINLMAFIPLMFQPKNTESSEGCVIYFLAQAISSSILLFSVMIKPQQLMLLSNDVFQTTIILSIMIKLGMPPFHNWFVSVMSKTEWSSCFMLMTWQKLAPLIVLSHLTFNMMFALIANLVAAITAINQTDLRKIMALSSIGHLGWMLTCMMESNTWLIYLILYSTMTLLMIIFLSKNKILFVSQMNKMITNLDKITISSLMMSMGGLPPFIGFVPKWLAIQSMLMSKNIMLMTILMMLSLITLFYYLRITNMMLLLGSVKTKWTISIHKSYNLFILMINLLLPPLLLLIN